MYTVLEYIFSQLICKGHCDVVIIVISEYSSNIYWRRVRIILCERVVFDNRDMHAHCTPILRCWWANLSFYCVHKRHISIPTGRLVVVSSPVPPLYLSAVSLLIFSTGYRRLLTIHNSKGPSLWAAGLFPTTRIYPHCIMFHTLIRWDSCLAYKLQGTAWSNYIPCSRNNAWQHHIHVTIPCR